MPKRGEETPDSGFSTKGGHEKRALASPCSSPKQGFKVTG